MGSRKYYQAACHDDTFPGSGRHPFLILRVASAHLVPQGRRGFKSNKDSNRGDRQGSFEEPNFAWQFTGQRASRRSSVNLRGSRWRSVNPALYRTRSLEWKKVPVRIIFTKFRPKLSALRDLLTQRSSDAMHRLVEQRTHQYRLADVGLVHSHLKGFLHRSNRRSTPGCYSIYGKAHVFCSGFRARSQSKRLTGIRMC